MLAILLMNVFAPTIDHYVVQGNIKKRMKRLKVKNCITNGKKTDNNGYTILICNGNGIVVGALLAFAASSLKRKIAENKRLKSNRTFCTQWVLMKMMKVA